MGHGLKTGRLMLMSTLRNDPRGSHRRQDCFYQPAMGVLMYSTGVHTPVYEDS